MSNTSAPVNLDRNQVRQRIRNQRNTITEDERRQAETQLAERLLRMTSFQRARHVSVYFAMDGELSLEKFMDRAARCNKQLYVPVIQGKDIRFTLLRRNVTMKLNRLGIPEPQEGPCIDARSLDLVLTPLVAFDDHGDRLGMGGGYYDRRFQFLQTRRTWIRPKLIGIGFELQHVQRINAEPWDVRLWSAVTEKDSYYFC